MYFAFFYAISYCFYEMFVIHYLKCVGTNIADTAHDNVGYQRRGRPLRTFFDLSQKNKSATTKQMHKPRTKEHAISKHVQQDRGTTIH